MEPAVWRLEACFFKSLASDTPLSLLYSYFTGHTGTSMHPYRPRARLLTVHVHTEFCSFCMHIVHGILLSSPFGQPAIESSFSTLVLSPGQARAEKGSHPPAGRPRPAPGQPLPGWGASVRKTLQPGKDVVCSSLLCSLIAASSDVLL